MMTTVSAKIDKGLKGKLASKARKEGKPLSEIIKEALNEVDFGKQEFTEVNNESKTRGGGEEVVSPILKKLSNLSAKVGEIENALVELGKAELCLGEAIIREARDHERKRLDETEREDANRIYLHNSIIRALEEIADKNLEVCKSNHPRLSSST